MKKLLAVSGGPDSMVMLDMFKNDPNVLVAHFNHGIRPSADQDQTFVAQVAHQLQKPFFATKVSLGANASEATARARRYEFLFQLAATHQATIFTAHHLDDLVESVAINLLRGTGWRGLTPFTISGVVRPFLDPQILPSTPYTKRQILAYAAKHQVAFRIDPTNYEDYYLRSRLRQKLQDFSDHQAIYELWQKQLTIKTDIDEVIQSALPSDRIHSRKAIAKLPRPIALEYLRAALTKAGLSATRPQLIDFLQAIKTYQPGKQFNLPGDRLVRLDSQTFTL